MWRHGPEEQKAAADKFGRDVLPVIEDIRAGGITTLSGIAAGLHDRGIETVRGGRWTARSVKNVLERITRADASSPRKDSGAGGRPAGV
jgi:hypothetical protein